MPRRGQTLTAVPPTNTPRARTRRTGQQVMKTDRQLVKDAYAQQSKVLLKRFGNLTAASEVMDAADSNRSNAAPNAVTRTWQHAAWGYVHSVGELNAAKMYVGNCLARCFLKVGKRNADGSIEQAFDGEEPAEGVDGDIANEAADIIATIRGPRGGQSELLRSFGEKIFVAGELYLVPEDTPAGMVFESLSTQELYKEGKQYVRYYGPGFKPEPLPIGTEPIRVWRPDAQYMKIADSSVRACLEILEELVVLTRLVRAAAISRMALSGILLLPDELDQPEGDGTDADGGQSEAQNPLAVDIINTGAKAIDDPASAAAFMPYVLQGQAEFLDKVKHIAFQGADQEYVIKRTEALQRLAQGLDLPVEVILGHMSTTFANAAQISIDTFKLHLEPSLQLFCDALTESVLWPAMAKNRNMNPQDLKGAPYPEEILAVAVTYDARELISRPDRSKEIVDVFIHDLTFTAIAISELREAIGLDPAGAPDDQEVARRIDAYRLGRIREVIQAPPADAAVPIADATAGKAVLPGQSAGDQLIGKEGKAGEAETKATKQAVEEETVAASGAPQITPLAVLAEKVAGAAELTIGRAVERVGSKLRDKSRSRTFDEAARQTIARVSKPQVPRVLGREMVEKVLGNPDELVLAEVTTLSKLVSDWATEYGCGDPSEAAGSIAALVMDGARSALYDQRPMKVTADMCAVRLQSSRT